MLKKIALSCLTVAMATTTVNTAYAASDYAKTKYPVVFAPGVLGFDKLFGFVDYWYGIIPDLNSNGTKTYVTTASAINTSEQRGEQMLKQVNDIFAISGAAKINIIGHSHGGFSARYVMDALPVGKVASITLVASPVKGSPVADVITKVAPAGSVSASVLNSIVNAAANLFSYFGNISEYQNSLSGLLGSVNTKAAADFAKLHPQGVPTTACGEGAYTGANGAKFYSFSGTSPLTNALDPLDGFFTAFSLAFVGTSDPQSDGFIGRCSSHFGKVLRDNYPWNHPDEINHTLAIRGLFTPNPVDVYRTQVNRLKVDGL